MSCNHSYHSLSYDVNEMNIEYAQGCHAKGKLDGDKKRYV